MTPFLLRPKPFAHPNLHKPSLAMKNGACRSTSTDGHRRTLTKDYEKLSEQTVEIKRMLTVLVQKLTAEG